MTDALVEQPQRAHDAATDRVGMVLCLGAGAMLFGALFFAYGYVRSHAPAWPPPGAPPLPRGHAAVSTLLLTLCSLSLHRAVRGRGREEADSGVAARGLRSDGEPRDAGGDVLWASLFGASFVASQGLLWRQLAEAGLPLAGGGPLASVLYGLTGLHALHVGVGLVGLVSLCVSGPCLRGAGSRHGALGLWAMYWHFLGGVWWAMFLAIFCL